MDTWVVVEYDRINIRAMGETETRCVPGNPSEATIVMAGNKLDAVKKAAGGPGYFAAFKCPPSAADLVRVSLEVA